MFLGAVPADDGATYIVVRVGENPETAYPAILRLRPDGDLDFDFAHLGILSLENWLGGSQVSPRSLVVDREGGLVVGGTLWSEGDPEVFVSKFDRGGQPAQFGKNGSVSIPYLLRSEADGFLGMAVREDGAVAFGLQLERGKRLELAVALLHRSGAFPQDFGEGVIKRLPDIGVEKLEPLAIRFADGDIELVAGRDQERARRFSAYRFVVPITSEAGDVQWSRITRLQQKARGGWISYAESSPDGRRLYLVLTGEEQTRPQIRLYQEGQFSRSNTFLKQPILRNFTLFNVKVMGDGTLVLMGQHEGSTALKRVIFDADLKFVDELMIPRLLNLDNESCAQRLLRHFLNDFDRLKR